MGRLWVLGAEDGLKVLAPEDLHVVATVPLPRGVTGTGFAINDAGAWLADSETRIAWHRPVGGEWRRLPDVPGFAPVLVAGQLGTPTYFVLHAVPTAPPPPAAPPAFEPDTAAPPSSGAPSFHLDARRLEGADAAVAWLEEEVFRVRPVPVGPAPSHAVVDAEGKLVLGPMPKTVDGKILPTLFRVFEIAGAEHDLRPDADEVWEVRGFDGRALARHADGTLIVTSGSGWRRLYDTRPDRLGRGQVETPAFDSERHGCHWHRVFLDVCLPRQGASVRVWAKATDTPPSKDLQLVARPPIGMAPRPPGDERFLSTSPDDAEGWIELRALDELPVLSDTAWPITEVAPLWAPYRDSAPPCPVRSEKVSPQDLGITLEGLLPTRPGRYLALRIELRGDGRRSPVLLGVRVTAPRPPWLEQLPAFWRADPETADGIERLLALFEGTLGAIDARIDALPALFDPRVCPPESLDWLASFVSLTLDDRLDLAQRRRLLLDASELRRKRGTVPGLVHLCRIVTKGEVDLIEGFRLRHRTGTILGIERDVGLGREGSVVGPGMQLGAPHVDPGSRGESWEVAIADARQQLETRFEAARARFEAEPTDDPFRRRCPPREPPVANAFPLDGDALIAFHRRFAHRFTVVVHQPRTDVLAALVEQAISASKPAHTLHEVCWLDDGFRLGVTSYVGFGTRIAHRPEVDCTLFGQTLGPFTRLSEPSPRRHRFVVGHAEAGRTTQLS
ncbi:MAG: phage tail protein [Sandaracinaceae bacterium]